MKHNVSKPATRIVHNVTLDGAQDEYRVSTYDGTKYIAVAGPMDAATLEAYRQARREDETV